MKIPTSMRRLKGYRFPREIIACAVRACHRFAPGTADVEDLLAERGVIASRETIRLWVNRFGAHFAACIRRDRPRPNDKWHLDEVVIPINGVKHWLRRAVDANGDTLDIPVQTRRNAKAAKRFMARLIAQSDQRGVVITDKLRSCIKPIAIRHRTPVIAPTKASATGLKAVTGRRGDGRKSWGGSSRRDRHNASSPHMTGSITSSALAAAASRQHHTVMQGQMPSASGLTIPPRWSLEIRRCALSKSRQNNLAMPVGEVLEDGSVIDHDTTLANGDMAPAVKRGKQHEQAGHTRAPVFIVEARFAPGPCRGRRAGQLLAGLVQADQRAGRITGAGADLRHVFHRSDKSWHSPCRTQDSARLGTDALADRRIGGMVDGVPGEVELAALPPGPTSDSTARRPLAGTARRAGGWCSSPEGCRATPPKRDRTVRARHRVRASTTRAPSEANCVPRNSSRTRL